MRKDMRKEVFVIDPNDNVATLVSENGIKGAAFRVTLEGKEVEITLADEIAFGHKFAIRPIRKGSAVVKYGHRIGEATADISPGEHVHLHNMESKRGRGDLVTAQADKETAR